ncbi:MAG: uL15 family ribosomal protein [Parcubacteria group bacterium]
MQLHQLKPIHKGEKPKRVGRGGDHGHFCGGGAAKGKSRATNVKPIVRELLKRYPKLRGYKSKALSKNTVILNLDIFDKKFDTGQTVSPQILIEKRLVRKIKSEVPRIKILGGGEIKKALVFEDFLISNSAKEKIKKAGGEIK